MTLFWFDQLISWITVGLGWWIIHQTGGARFHVAAFLIRFGVGGYVLSLAIVTVFQVSQVPAPSADPFFKFFLAIMFIGIILFHHRRFQKL